VLARKETYSFETIHNIDPYGSDFVPTFRGGIKCWNMCVQYWLAVNVYKRLPRNQFRCGSHTALGSVYTFFPCCISRCTPALGKRRLLNDYLTLRVSDSHFLDILFAWVMCKCFAVVVKSIS
jgi:hypothetical protein